MQGDLFVDAAASSREARASHSITWDLRSGIWQEALRDVGDVDALITDAPYSERCHSGHDRGAKGGKTKRAALPYQSMTPDDVDDFVTQWSPRTKGWFVAMTDHVLMPHWEKALERAGRLVFAPIPFVARGSRVRLQGDGPSCWCVWIMAARPRTKEMLKWGALPGAYVLPEGQSRDQVVTGGKSVWLMRELVRHYSRPGELVCDPCAGGGTTLLAARLEGRSSIGAEADPQRFTLAHARLSRPYTPPLPWHDSAPENDYFPHAHAEVSP
jgi:hypothetical protein